MPTNVAGRPYRPKGHRALRDMSSGAVAALLPRGRLDDGSHDPPGEESNGDGELCLMEAVAYVTGEPHSDHPRCACPALTSIGIHFNDSDTHDQHERDKLIAAIPALVGSRTGSSRVRWKRAKLLVSLLLERAADAAREELSEAPSLAMISELDSLKGLKNRTAAARALAIMEVLQDSAGLEGEAAYHALRHLVASWNSDGLGPKAYSRVMPEDLSDVFTTGVEQAELLERLGSIRS